MEARENMQDSAQAEKEPFRSVVDYHAEASEHGYPEAIHRH